MSVSIRKDENGNTEYKALRDSMPLNQKLYLTVPEAAVYTGLSYGKISNIVAHPTPDCDFLLKVGRKNMIHREKFEKYLSNIKEI